MPARRSLLAPFALLLAGCGYVGDPLPPTLDIPRRVTDLRVRQRADRLLVDFTIPELTTEGLALGLAKVDLRAGPYTREPFDAEAWAAGARPLDTSNLKPGPAHLEVDAGAWIGREAFWRVRLFGHKGRDSGWSDFVAFRVVPPPQPPAGFGAEATAEGVRLSWTEETTLRILRGSGKQPPADVATVSGRGWLDSNVRFGETYEYAARTVIRSGESTATSELTAPVVITPLDTFPPAVPQALAALAASSSIELTWEQNTESDLRGYYVYRAVGDGEFERLGDLRQVPGLSDRDVKPATRYRYSVSAVDRNGNQSARSAPVEASMP